MKKTYHSSGAFAKRIYICGIALCIMVFTVFMTGCGSGSSGSYSVASEEMAGGTGDEVSYSGLDTGEVVDENSVNSASSSDTEKSLSASSQSTETSGEDYSQKLIYTYDFCFETEEFDQSVEFIEDALSRYNGYMENSSVYGTSGRNGSMTLRIPVEHVDEFLAETGSIGTMTSKNVSTEDITLEYFDIKAHLETLNTQRDRLLELLKKAEKVKDITELESQISDIEYEINSYTTQMKVYDNQVDYATVYIELSEVEQISAQEEDNFITRITKGLSGNTADVLNGVVNFIIWLVTMIPYFIVLAVVVILIKVIVRLIRRKNPDFGKLSGKNKKAKNGNDSDKEN